MEKREKKRRGLPPLVSKYDKYGVVWKRLENVDHELLGYLLSCHLVIEHYIDNFLSTNISTELSWKTARLSFSQKVELLSGTNIFEPPYDFVSSIAHLNKLRNRYAHDIETKLLTKDLKPLYESILEMTDGKGEEPNDPYQILEVFTLFVCAWFGGAISIASKN